MSQKASTRDKAMRIYKEASESYHQDRLEWMRTEAEDGEIVAMAASAQHIRRKGSVAGIDPIIAKVAAKANDRFAAWYVNRKRKR